MQARHTISSSSCIGGGEGWSFGGFRECVGAVQGTRFRVAARHCQGLWSPPNRKPPTPEDPSPCLFWAWRVTLPLPNRPGREEISSGLGGTRVVRIGDAASAARLMCSNLCFDTIV